MTTQTIPLGDLVEIKGGGTPSRTVSEFWNGNIPWATVKDFKSTALDTTEEFITLEGLKRSATNIIPSGNVIIPTRMAVGKAAINSVDMAINQDLKALLPKGKINKRFLLHFLLAKGDFLEGQAQGATVKGIKLDLLRTLPFPALGLDEQRRIAAILDKADAIRRKRQQALTLAEDFHKSMFLEMFGDELFDQEKASYRSIAALIDDGSIVEMQDGNHGKIHPKLKDFSTSGTPFVAANMIRTGRLITGGAHHLPDIWLKKLRIGFAKPRDVLLSHKGSIGFVAIVDADTPQLILSPQVTYYRTNQEKIIPEYLAAYFRSGVFQAELEKFSKQSTRAYIGITRQKSLHIVVPETRKQRKFCEVVSKLEAAIPNLRAGTDHANILFASLSQRAFRGEL